MDAAVRRGAMGGGGGASRLGRRAAMRSGAGFTLLEIMFAVAVMAILAALAYGQFADYAERSRIAVAEADIVTMTVEIVRFQSANDGRLPDSLGEIGRGEFLDPWKRTYHYVNLRGVSKGKARKDHRLNPINSDYDLFSAGKNGVFKPQVSQKDSLDDVIRARDGAYIGVAEKF